MFKVLQRSVKTKEGIDELFEKFYESEDEADQKGMLEIYAQEVNENDDHGHEHDTDKKFRHAHAMKRVVERTDEEK